MAVRALVFVCIFLSIVAKHDAFSTLNGFWRTAPVRSGEPSKRHEACAVMVQGKVFLLGGRGTNRDVDIYDPKTRVWTSKPGPGSGIQIHHFQCVAIGSKVYIISSWTGGFPHEANNDKIYIYNTKTFTWSTKNGLPPSRRRGGGACIRKGNWIYLIAGNRGGHGEHATSLPWVDAYNWKTDTWQTGLPSMPASAARDHVGGAKVKGQLCIAGGRNGGVRNFFTANMGSTYCYNFKTKAWEKKMNFPVPRAGAMTARTCDGRMMIAGGEGNGQAYNRVDVFDGVKWEKAKGMVQGRHGSGLAVATCSCGHIFIPSGSGGQGGGPELVTTEQFRPKGKPNCAKY